MPRRFWPPYAFVCAIAVLATVALTSWHLANHATRPAPPSHPAEDDYHREFGELCARQVQESDALRARIRDARERFSLVEVEVLQDDLDHLVEVVHAREARAILARYGRIREE